MKLKIERIIDHDVNASWLTNGLVLSVVRSFEEYIKDNWSWLSEFIISTSKNVVTIHGCMMDGGFVLFIGDSNTIIRYIRFNTDMECYFGYMITENVFDYTFLSKTGYNKIDHELINNVRKFCSNQRLKNAKKMFCFIETRYYHITEFKDQLIAYLMIPSFGRIEMFESFLDMKQLGYLINKN